MSKPMIDIPEASTETIAILMAMGVLYIDDSGIHTIDSEMK